MDAADRTKGTRSVLLPVSYRVIISRFFFFFFYISVLALLLRQPQLFTKRIIMKTIKACLVDFRSFSSYHTKLSQALDFPFSHTYTRTHFHTCAHFFLLPFDLLVTSHRPPFCFSGNITRLPID